MKFRRYFPVACIFFAHSPPFWRKTGALALCQKVFSTNKQVAERGQQMQPVVVLGQAAIANFAVAKDLLYVPEWMLDLGTNAGFDFLGFKLFSIQRFSCPRARSDVPRYVLAVLMFRPLLNTEVAGIAENPLLFTMQQLVLGFSGMVWLIAYVLIVWGSYGAKFNKKMVFLGGIVVALLVVLVSSSYMFLGRDPYEFILLRLAMQGQLLWSVLAEEEIRLVDYEYIDCFFGLCYGASSGLDFLSERYLPVDLYRFYSDNGSVLSGSNPALAILSFGVMPSLLINIIFALVFRVFECGSCEKY